METKCSHVCIMYENTDLVPEPHFVVWPSCAHLDCAPKDAVHVNEAVVKTRCFSKLDFFKGRLGKTKGDILGDLTKQWHRVRLCRARQLCLCLYDIKKSRNNPKICYNKLFLCLSRSQHFTGFVH